MERQRSFAAKSTRFLVFSLAISSSVVFLTLFFFCVIKATPSFTRQIHVQYKEPPFSSAVVRGFAEEAVTGFNGDLSVKSSILTDAHFSPAQIVPEIPSISAEFPRKENGSTNSKIAGDEVKLGDSSNYNGTSFSFYPKMSAVVSKNPEVNSGVVVDSITERPQDLRAELYSGNNLSSHSTNRDQNVSDDSSQKVKFPSTNRIKEKRKSSCGVTEGEWVLEESYPLYRNTTCPFIDEGFNCEANGRPDKDYMKWRWQPRHCDIPRFNATKMLELIRGKRLVFAGDSLNRNQWESMLCLLLGAVKDPKKVYETLGRRITKAKGNYSFKFEDYKCTVEYYVTHFLVHESKARIGRKRVQTLRIDTIDKGSSKWRGADILVFNTAHWWSHHKTKAGINYYQEGDQVHPRLDVSVAFRKAMVTWASWLDRYINPRKTQVFYRSLAPSHFSGGQWNTGGHCRDASQPTNAIPTGVGSEKNIIVEEVLRQMKTPVTFLNITGLSSYRVDGHPSIYGRSRSSGVQDCSHWCLPGVPDSWNEMLYYHLLDNGRNSARS